MLDKEKIYPFTRYEGIMAKLGLNDKKFLNEIDIMNADAKPDLQGNVNLKFNLNGKKVKIKMHKIDDNEITGDFLSG